MQEPYMIPLVYLFGQMILDSANAQGAWVDYTRKDPSIGEEHQKSSWAVQHRGYVFGVGVYR